MSAPELQLSEIMEMIVALASNDFSRRVRIGDGSSLSDGMASGLNMLAEELERRQLAEQEMQKRVNHAERLAAIGQLAAGVAHEVNNPATYVLGNSSLMLEQLDSLRAAVDEIVSAFPTSSPQQQKIREILERREVLLAVAEWQEMLRENLHGVQRIVSIVKDLRAFARIEPERLDLVDLNQVVQDACTLVQKQASYRAQLTKRLDQAPTTIAGDRNRLTQVVTNLLVNAVDAVPEGTPEAHSIEVATHVVGDEIELTVRDTGCGIPPEVVDRIFEPFFTTKPRETGTGLGLSISAEIVRKHGGHIEVKSAVGEGTCFTVYLPIRIAMPAEETGVPTFVPLKTRPRLLVIDDEPSLLKHYRRMFHPICEVVVASSGAEALQRIADDEPFDAVLCDLMMPEMDGASFYDELKVRNPSLATRTAWVSGGAFTPRTVAFAIEHAAWVLDKPLHEGDAVALIARLLTQGTNG